MWHNLLIVIFCIASSILTGCFLEKSSNDSDVDSEMLFTYVSPLADLYEPKYFFFDFINNEIDSIMLDTVTSFAAKICHSKDDFICIESEILTFAVPKANKLSNLEQWTYKNILFKNRGKIEFKILASSIEVWKIETVSCGFGEPKCKFLYTPELGLVSFGFFFKDGLNKTYILSGTQGILARE